MSKRKYTHIKEVETQIISMREAGMIRQEIADEGDWSMQIVRMIVGGVFDSYPQLKICTGYWGEVVSYYMYRLDEIGENVTGIKKDVSEYFKENVYVNPSGMMKVNWYPVGENAC